MKEILEWVANVVLQHEVDCSTSNCRYSSSWLISSMFSNFRSHRQRRWCSITFWISWTHPSPIHNSFYSTDLNTRVNELEQGSTHSLEISARYLLYYSVLDSHLYYMIAFFCISLNRRMQLMITMKKSDVLFFLERNWNILGVMFACQHCQFNSICRLQRCPIAAIFHTLIVLEYAWVLFS